MKRLVICADGTWNLRDQVDKESGKRRPTNVTKLARAVRQKASDGTPQIVIYHDGVGTKGGLDKITGGAFGRGIEGNIRDLYRSLLYNYVAGDEIYMFGFSRGAFTVRTLAGFLAFVGLLQKDDDYYLPELYACYEHGCGPNTEDWKDAFHNIQDQQPAPSIRMMGVWDTVGALGAPGLLGQLFNGKKYQYHQIGLTPQIQHAYHALALDERRKPFAPNVWDRPKGWTGELQQAWFPGVHSNVGGGYRPDGLANEALHWIVEKAELLGLEFDSAYLQHFKPCFNSVLFDSMSPMYRTMGPNIRRVGQYLPAGEAIHKSAIDRKNLAECGYNPKNLIGVVGQIPVVDTTRVQRGIPC